MCPAEAVQRVRRAWGPDSPRCGAGDPGALGTQGHRAADSGQWGLCLATSLTVRGTAAFGRRVHLVGIRGTGGLQRPFSLFFLILIVYTATTWK